jgi:hypothetical protein
MREKTYIDELLGRGSSKQTEPQIQGDKGRRPPIFSWKGPLRNLPTYYATLELGFRV